MRLVIQINAQGLSFSLIVCHCFLHFLCCYNFHVIALCNRWKRHDINVIYYCYYPSSELLDSLHWVPIEKRGIFKILLHIFKSLNDLSPKYLADCFKIYIPPREGLHSALHETRLVVPKTNRLIGNRFFSVRGLILWNNIPPSIKISTTVCSFKKSLKTHLYHINLLCLCKYSCILLFKIILFFFCVKRFEAL